ncbi:cytosolic phospholipase A2-like [Clavelina lepadiformis]|uniref:cytosolic phospholipase A2-like n=1 Tax=Clavelina lepadiformis TaxID=159417 RepID=UPI0040419C21
MFQAEVTPCIQLTVRVISGRNITTGHIFRTTDPYIKIYIKESPDARRQTRYINNNKNPEWNETFTYFLPKDLSGIMAEFTLMDSNYGSDGVMGKVKFDVSSLIAGETVTKTFDFDGTSQVEIEFKTEERFESDLRLGTSLCDKEESFRKTRKEKIFQSMCQLLEKHGIEGGPQIADEVPVIGVLGSGGGFRATVGYAGVMKALHDTGILDCSMYVNGLSGSSWYLSTLYANEAFPDDGLNKAHNEIRSNINSHPLMDLIWHFTSYRNAAIAKRKAGQPISYTDIFGMIIGNTLLGKEKRVKSKLSQFQEKIEDANVPMPILTAVHVGADEPAAVFHDWVEFSPYEIGIAKYGSFMDTTHFGTKFFCGVKAEEFQESPLHYVMGICGSAYAILFKDYVRNFAKGKPFLSFLLRPIWETSKEPEKEKVLEASEKLDLWKGHKSGEMNYHDSVLKAVPVGGDHEDGNETDEEAIEEKRKRKKEKTEEPSGDNLTSALDDLLLGGDDDENEQKSQGFGIRKWFYETIFGIDHLQTRGLRTARVFNYMRRVWINKIQSSTELPNEKDTGKTFRNINEPLEVDKKTIYVADAGIAFNSPYPPMLRAERGVDIILSFDFSARKEDDTDPLNELYLAEEWAKVSGMPFPKISRDTYKKEGLKECYVFRDEENEKAPIVIHFVLCNINFRKYSAPGVLRDEGDEWGDFNIFSTEHEHNPYSTFNFHYTNMQFDKLFQLMQFNTLLHLDVILEQISYGSERRRRQQS